MAFANFPPAGFRLTIRLITVKHILYNILHGFGRDQLDGKPNPTGSKLAEDPWEEEQLILSN